MLQPKHNQRGSLFILELGILATLVVTTGIVLAQVQQAKSKTKTNTSTNQAQTAAQKKSSTQPTPSTPQAIPTQTSTTPEKLNTAPPLASSGISGQIYLGAATGCYSPDPNGSCNKPRTQAGTVIVKGPNGIVQAVKSNSNGYFLVSTTTGTYTVELQGSTGSPTPVEVKPGVYTEVTLYAN